MTELKISDPTVEPNVSTVQKCYAIWVTHPGDLPQRDWFVIDSISGEIKLDGKVIGCDLELARAIVSHVQNTVTEEAEILRLYADSLHFEDGTFKSPQEKPEDPMVKEDMTTVAGSDPKKQRDPT